jgi:tRNA 2-thiouridine synthesizing protein A
VNGPVARVDVRAFSCPITWVRTRIALEPLRPGDLLEVLLREGEPLQNLPGSASEDGHRVVTVEPVGGGAPGSWRIVLQKGAPPAALP